MYKLLQPRIRETEPSDTVRRALLQALAEPGVLTQGSKVVRDFCQQVDWSKQPSKSQFALQESVYQECKARGYDKQLSRHHLDRLLPIDPRLTAKKLAQKDALRGQQDLLRMQKLQEDLLATGKQEVAHVKAALTKATQEMFARCQQSAQTAADAYLAGRLAAIEAHETTLRTQQTTLLAEQERVSTAAAAMFSERMAVLAAREVALQDAQSKLLVADAAWHERMAALQVAERRDRAVDSLLQTSAKVRSQPPSEFRVALGGTTFTFLRQKLAEKEGYLSDLFLSGRWTLPPCDDRGAYLLELPDVTPDEFSYVQRWYNDETPSFLTTETLFKLVPLISRLDIPNMLRDLQASTEKKTDSAKEPRYEYRRQVRIVTNSHHHQNMTNAEELASPGREWRLAAFTKSQDENYQSLMYETLIWEREVQP